MILVPEIALTPQMMARFTAYFGRKVALLHSGLRLTERWDQYKRIRRGEATVVLGTRSAVFAPLERLGLIILDEEQESSYESEKAPCYHARDIAKYRCVQEEARLVLGSATPTVETAYYARKGGLRPLPPDGALQSAPPAAGHSGVNVLHLKLIKNLLCGIRHFFRIQPDAVMKLLFFSDEYVFRNGCARKGPLLLNNHANALSCCVNHILRAIRLTIQEEFT